MDKDHLKKFKTIDEQIRYLASKKRIIADSTNSHVLEERNYVSLINPYKELFATWYKSQNGSNEHHYDNDTSLDDVICAAKIDDVYSTILYSQIGIFERKLKVQLFYDLSKLYAEDGDECCVSYTDEIKHFLKNPKSGLLPKIALNYHYIVSRNGNNYTEDTGILDRRVQVLEKIYEIGTGENIDGTEVSSDNVLIQHYRKKSIVPLWVVPNGLTFGELQTLYHIVPNDVQRSVTINMSDITDPDHFNARKVSAFAGSLEVIRNLRNVINHYEPVLPFLYTNCGKHPRNSQLFKVLELLEYNMKHSIVGTHEIKKPSSVSCYNVRLNDIFTYMTSKI